MGMRLPFVVPTHKRSRLAILLVLCGLITTFTLLSARLPSSPLSNLASLRLIDRTETYLPRGRTRHRDTHFGTFGGTREDGVRTIEEKKEDAESVRALIGALDERGWEAEHENREWTVSSLDHLADCLETDTCGSGEETVVVLGTFHFNMARQGGVSGEDIWAMSSIESLTILNHTRLYLPHYPSVLLAHQYIGHLIPIILFEGEEMAACFAASGSASMGDGDGDSVSSTDEPDLQVRAGEQVAFDGSANKATMSNGCISTISFPNGIPAWKAFAFHFWADAVSPLGSKWTLSPEPYTYASRAGNEDNNYLGYSIESVCTTRPYVPASDRIQRAAILGKRLSQLSRPLMAFPNMLEGVAHRLSLNDTSARASASTTANSIYGTESEPSGKGFHFVSSANADPEDAPTESSNVDAFLTSEGMPEEGIYRIDPQGQAEWFDELGKGVALLGVGWPELSPSPYDALCMGVPFINVIKEWAETDPSNKTFWHTQHDALLDVPEPYVYHIFQHDAEGLARALQAAIEHPIERYIVPRMSTQAVTDRHYALINTDWHAVAWTEFGERADEVDWLW